MDTWWMHKSHIGHSGDGAGAGWLVVVVIAQGKLSFDAAAVDDEEEGNWS